jgi:hypothetical protein
MNERPAHYGLGEAKVRNSGPAYHGRIVSKMSVVIVFTTRQRPLCCLQKWSSELLELSDVV